MNLRRREFVTLGVVAAVAATVGAVAGVLTRQSRSGAPDLLAHTFSDLAGEPRRLLEWQGRPLVCNFWATWCAPCREELPLLNAAQQRHAAHNGLQVVGIAIDNEANVREFLEKVPLDFPILIGGADAIAVMRRLGNPGGGLPYTVLLDRHGAIRTRKLGAYSEAELRGELEALLR
jgi:thiol-disulfide isomerase/thioredoxin